MMNSTAPMFFSKPVVEHLKKRLETWILDAINSVTKGWA
jgi:hypothetical protein